MKVPAQLSLAFGEEFEKQIAQFAWEQKLLPEPESIRSSRFLSRSLIPHVLKLSSLFNRDEKNQSSSLAPYWKESSNPAHLRLAYFLYFMPCNLYRVASVWCELERLGYRWPSSGPFKGIEFGAGPASGVCGIAAGEIRGIPPERRIGIPHQGDWALIEQDKAVLELGSEWAKTYFSHLGLSDWGTRNFHRKIELEKGFLPRSAPKFHLWLMSYYLNELDVSATDLARRLLDAWDRHLEDEGLVILVEPALRSQSRRLLELRQAILTEQKKRKPIVQVLLPCLGHQSCGALANPEDWCHEEVMWWRPPYLRSIDQMAELDRKSLPFSYLVLAKSQRPREEILPELKGSTSQTRHRLVSPAYQQGQELEFFLCSETGKRRARYRPPLRLKKNFQSESAPVHEQFGEVLSRGDVLVNPEINEDQSPARVRVLNRVDR